LLLAAKGLARWVVPQPGAVRILIQRAQFKAAARTRPESGAVVPVTVVGTAVMAFLVVVVVVLPVILETAVMAVFLVLLGALALAAVAVVVADLTLLVPVLLMFSRALAVVAE
jgi:hypothetical protein